MREALPSYLFVETRSDVDTPDARALLSLATSLHAAGHRVSVYLMQNAVVMAGHGPLVRHLVRCGVAVLVDRYSMRARGFGSDTVLEGATAAEMAELVELVMTPGVVTIWH